jgi:hypothetical protein
MNLAASPAYTFALRAARRLSRFGSSGTRWIGYVAPARCWHHARYSLAPSATGSRETFSVTGLPEDLFGCAWDAGRGRLRIESAHETASVSAVTTSHYLSRSKAPAPTTPAIALTYSLTQIRGKPKRRLPAIPGNAFSFAAILFRPLASAAGSPTRAQADLIGNEAACYFFRLPTLAADERRKLRSFFHFAIS